MVAYHTFHERVKELFERFPLVQRVGKDISHEGATLYMVGGAVRDLMLAIPVYDIDFEVHGISLETLGKVLEKYGPVSYVGKSFGVLKLHGFPFDFSLPRRDSAGRKPEVAIDASLSMQDACSRRDLTMNAMALNVITLDLIDPFHGLEDLQQGILRTPDRSKFVEDPLRFYRVMQFIGRFNMQPDQELNELCAHMDLKGLSVERIEKEFEKLCLKSESPSLGVRWLERIGRLKELLPELAMTCGVPQNPEYHPEGDVFEHSMQAFDASADHNYKNDEEKLTIMLAALCHDLGKAITTELRKGRITSYRHEEVGLPLVRALLKRITTKKSMIDVILRLVRHHMAPGMFIRQEVKAKTYKKLALKLAPLATLEMLGFLALADRRGRNGQSHKPLASDVQIEEFVKRAREAAVLEHPEEPILEGKDLLDFIPPGPRLGQALKFAYRLQIEEGIQDKVELRSRVAEHFKS